MMAGPSSLVYGAPDDTPVPTIDGVIDCERG
jgi:hypothetical protein